MTKLGRSIHFLIFGVLAATSCTQKRSSVPEQRPPVSEQGSVRERIARTYGLDSFGQIEAIRYTWNGEIPGLFKLAHAWEWEPKTN